jgi:SH3 domain protein
LEPIVRRCLAVVLLLAGAHARAADDTRYVSDEITIVLREGPRADASSRGVISTGARVEVLETDPASGYARIRTADRRDGWILERFLKKEPVARERVQRLEKDLAAAEAELKKLKDEHAKVLQDFARISGGEPIASKEVLAESAGLREQVARKDEEVAAIRERYDAQRGTQRTLLIGGGLVAAGMLMALLLRLLWPKKRWGDF